MKVQRVDNGSFMLFVFGIAMMIMSLLIFIPYLIYKCMETEEDVDELSNELPNSLKINLNDYNKLSPAKLPYFNTLSDIEKVTYLLSIAYCKYNSPQLSKIELKSSNISTESLLIRERGINSFHFKSFSIDQINEIVDQLESDETDEILNENSLLVNNFETDFKDNLILKLLKNFHYYKIIPKMNPFIVEDLVEINFNSNKIGNFAYSTTLNLPIPTINRKNDTIYFESKLLKFNKDSTIVSIGLVTDENYPNFQLPGYLPYSFAIESTGQLKITKVGGDTDMVVLPQLNEGDVIGLGYKSLTGTIFLTHNGKLIYEIIRHFKFKLFPCIGYKNLQSNAKCDNCKVNVNLGQLGFVYIEGNVKKLGFCESNNDGIIGAPPLYNKSINVNETIIVKGDEIPPEYPVEEEDFFNSTKVEKNVSVVDQPEEKTERTTTPESEPPSYTSEKRKSSGVPTPDLNPINGIPLPSPSPVKPGKSVIQSNTRKNIKKKKKVKKAKNKTTF